MIGCRAANLALILAFSVLSSGGDGPVAERELIANPVFETGGRDTPAQGWTLWQPVCEEAACQVRRVEGGLLVEAAGDPHAVGGVVQEIANIKSGQAYAINVASQLRGIRAPFHSLLVRVGWSRGGKWLHPAGMLVKGPVVEGDMARFSDVLVAPEGADAADLSLEVKWPGAGSVLWQSVSMRPTAPPAVSRD